MPNFVPGKVPLIHGKWFTFPHQTEPCHCLLIISCLHLTASHYFYNVLIFNILPKLPLRLGASESTQRQPAFLQVTDYQSSQKEPDGCGVKNMPVKSASPTSSTGPTSLTSPSYPSYPSSPAFPRQRCCFPGRQKTKVWSGLHFIKSLAINDLLKLSSLLKGMRTWSKASHIFLNN